jgi:hypothetical protein
VTVPEKETCDGRCDATGKCDPAHPLHCCHLARSIFSGPFVGYRCEKCGKRSKTWTMLTSTAEPPAI